MARPTKSAFLIDNNVNKINNEVVQARIEQEKKLKGKSDKLKPPSYLTKGAKKVFKFVLEELKEGDILCNADIFVLEQLALTVDKCKTFEEMMQNETDIGKIDKISKIYDRYAKYLSRYFNELCLSPQSRAKIGALKVNAQEEEQDPLLTALRERNSYE